MHAAPAAPMLALVCLVGFTGGGCGSGGVVVVSSKPKSTGALRSVTAKITAKAPPRRPRMTLPRRPPLRRHSLRTAPRRRRGPSRRTPRSPRPQDVADWKGNDYEGALRDGDSQLAAALDISARIRRKREGRQLSGEPAGVCSFAEPGAGTAAAPVGLSSLRRSPSASGRNAKFTEAAVAALGVNGTPRARQILEAIIAGTFKKADKQTRLALNTLAADRGARPTTCCSAGYERPSSPRRTRATRDSESGRLAALQLIPSRSSESLSLRLAKAVATTEMPKRVAHPIWACLSEPRMENVAAQIMLYQSDRLDPATRPWLEQRVLAYSSTLGRLLGLPANGTASCAYVPAGGAAPTISLGQQPRGASSAPCSVEPLPCRRVVVEFEPGRRAGAAVGGPGKPGPSACRSSRWPLRCPMQRCRAALLRASERHWEESPKPLLALSRTDALNVEPGLVVLVKACRETTLRKCWPAATAIISVLRGRQSGRRDLMCMSEKNAGVLEAKRHREQLGQEWLEFSRAVVQAACRRYYAAARPPTRAARHQRRCRPAIRSWTRRRGYGVSTG